MNPFSSRYHLFSSVLIRSQPILLIAKSGQRMGLTECLDKGMILRQKLAEFLFDGSFVL
jgi:hypothetical protein